MEPEHEYYTTKRLFFKTPFITRDGDERVYAQWYIPAEWNVSPGDWIQFKIWKATEHEPEEWIDAIACKQGHSSLIYLGGKTPYEDVLYTVKGRRYDDRRRGIKEGDKGKTD